MNPILAAAVEVLEVCGASNLPCCVIGGLAVQRWGEPRLTRDVDVTVLCEFGQEDQVTELLLARLGTRRDDARAFAVRARVLLATSSNGVPVDVALGAVPFEQRAVARASDHAYPGGAVLRTCSAEDLVVMKAFAGRPQDWLDVTGIAARQGSRLDRAQIVEELAPLLELKVASEDLRRLEAVLDEHGRG